MSDKSDDENHDAHNKGAVLRTTETNMHPEAFANREKLVADEMIRYYDSNDDEYNNMGDVNNIFNLDENIHSHNKKSESKDNVFDKKEDNEKKSQGDYEKAKTEKNKSDAYHETNSSSNQKKESVDFKMEDDDALLEKKSTEELVLLQLDMLRKLGELKTHKVMLSQNYYLIQGDKRAMIGNYKMMKYEYELHTGIKSKQNSIQWMSGMMIGLLRGAEMLNDNYNPFDIKLEGWSNKVSSSITDYYDVLGEIYEKYNTPGKKMAPEFKLFLMLSGSAISIQMHRGIAKMIPGQAQSIEDDPDMIEQLRNKAFQDSRNVSNALKERAEKEHEEANQKARDIKELQNQELEYNKIMMMLDEEGENFNKFAKGLELSPSPISESSKQKSHNSSQHRNTKQNMANLAQQNQYLMNQMAIMNSHNVQKNAELKRQRETLENMLSAYENSTDNRKTKARSEKKTTESSVDTESSNISSISINHKLESQLRKNMKNKEDSSSLSMTSTSSTKTPPKKQPQPRQKRVVDKSELSYEAISIGSKKNNKRR